MTSFAHLGSVTVVGKQVDSASAEPGDEASGAESPQASDSGGRSSQSLKRLEVQGQASNVGASHRGSGDGVGSRSRADPCRSDGTAGREHVDTGAEVGVGGKDVSVGRGADRECVGGGGGRDIGNVLGVVTSGDDGEDARTVSRVDGGVEGSRDGSAERHGDDGGGLTGLGDDVVDSP